MTTPEALKTLYAALGGEQAVTSMKTVDVLAAIAELYGGEGGRTIPEAISGIAANSSGLVKPTGTKSITANGSNIDVAAYAKANVNVPASAVVSGTKNITANGTNIDVTNYAAVDVAVQSTEYEGEIKIVNNLLHNDIIVRYYAPDGMREKTIAQGHEDTIPTLFVQVNDAMYSQGMIKISATGQSEALSITRNGSNTMQLGRVSDYVYFVYFNMYEKTGVLTVAPSA